MANNCSAMTEPPAGHNEHRQQETGEDKARRGAGGRTRAVVGKQDRTRLQGDEGQCEQRDPDEHLPAVRLRGKEHQGGGDEEYHTDIETPTAPVP
ncbi:hypothetical protein [Arthrobacter sedimenti]|uniref:hypothetical protein n=1 Tax=Arthrobacter sedimenti TaxID=2694931 RepID=UPI001CDBCD42|nr:hypothetical protein [Arthrobacter sedimenti]